MVVRVVPSSLCDLTNQISGPNAVWSLNVEEIIFEIELHPNAKYHSERIGP